MLLNKIPCLDKGYVALVEATCNSTKLTDISREFFQKDDSKFLRGLGNLTLVIKCPLFVQLHLATFDLKLIPVPVSEKDIEAYLPNVGETGVSNVADSNEIVQNMKATTDALLINPVAYQDDGCDRFISQILTPINTYTTLIAQGPYSEWKAFCEQQRLPGPIKSYVKAITQIANVEWK